MFVPCDCFPSVTPAPRHRHCHPLAQYITDPETCDSRPPHQLANSPKSSSTFIVLKVLFIILLNTSIIYDLRFSHNLRRDTTLLAIVTMAFLTVSGGSDTIVCNPLIQFARITYRMHQIIVFFLVQCRHFIR